MSLFPLRLSSQNRYQNFYLRDKEDELVNGIVIKQSLMDQIIGTAYSLVPNNFVQVRHLTPIPIAPLTLIGICWSEYH